MQKFKFWVLAAMLVLCVGLVAGCGTSKDKTDSGSNDRGDGSGSVNETSSVSDSMGNTSTNGANNTEEDINNGAQPQTTSNSTGNEGSVTDNTNADGVINEIVTDIGNGIEDIGNGMSGDDNSNVNDVTSGRRR